MAINPPAAPPEDDDGTPVWARNLLETLSKEVVKLKEQVSNVQPTTVSTGPQSPAQPEPEPEPERKPKRRSGWIFKD